MFRSSISITPATIAAWAIAVTACSDNRVSAFDAELKPGDVLVFTKINTDSRVTSVEWSEVDENGAASFALDVEDDERWTTFVLSHGDYIDAEGEPIPLVDVAEVAVAGRGDVAGYGDCHRCMMRVATAPQRLEDGDSCSLPLFVRRVDSPDDPLSPGLADNLRKSIEIRMPGDCACPIEAVQPLAGLERTILWPEGERDILTQGAMTSSGTFGGFSEYRAVVIGPDGIKLAERGHDELSFVGWIHQAVAWGERFLVISAGERTPETIAQAQSRKIYLLDQALETTRELTLRGAVLNPRVAAVASDEVAYIGGEVTTNAGPLRRLARCTAISGGLDCDFINVDWEELGFGPDELLSLGAELLLAIPRPDEAQRGYLIDAASERAISVSGLQIDPSLSGWTWRHGIPLRDEGAVIACLSPEEGSGDGTAIVRADIDPSVFDSAPTAAGFTLAAPPTDFVCNGFFEANDKVFVNTNGGTYEIDPATGQPSADAVNLAAELGMPLSIDAMNASTPGFSVLRTGRRSFFSSCPGCSGVRYLAGPKDPAPPGNLLAANDQTVYALGSSEAFYLEGRKLVRDEALSELIDGSPDAAVWLGGTWLLASMTAGKARLVELDPARGTQTEWSAGAIDQPVEVMVRLGDDKIIGLSSGQLFSLDLDRTEEIEVGWDDPFTEETEVAPDRMLCEMTTYPLSRGPVRRSPWITALTATAGVVYATGCNQTIFRLRLNAGEIVVERIALALPGEEGTENQGLRAAWAQCPDELLVAARGHLTTGLSSGLIWEVTAGDNSREDGLLARLHPDHVQISPLVQADFLPLGFAGTPRHPMVHGTVHVQPIGSPEVQRFGAYVVDAETDPATGAVVVVNESRWLFLLSP